MSMLYTVAFPEIGLAPREAIEHLRKQHDGPRAATLPAHFVLVAGCDALPQEVYLAHVAAISAACKPVEFHCRYAMLGFDAERELSSVGLVPEEGYAAMSLCTITCTAVRWNVTCAPTCHSRRTSVSAP